MESLDQRIRRLRESKGLSQQAVAERLGVSRVAVTKWENGMTANLKLANLLAFCELFSISVEELVRGERCQDGYRGQQSKGACQCATGAWGAYKNADAETQAAVDLLLLPSEAHKHLTPEASAVIFLLKSKAIQEVVMKKKEDNFQKAKAASRSY